LNALQVLHFLSSHPIRDLATVAVPVALLLAIGHYWPGWTEAKFRAVTVACFFVGLYDWARQLGHGPWVRFNRLIGRRP
jgi:hypothetical protein